MEIVVRIVGIYLFVVTLEVLKEHLFVMVCEVRAWVFLWRGVGTFLWRGVG